MLPDGVKDGRTSRESQARRLASCDEDLARITADVTDLHAELVGLRAHGLALTKRVAEGDAERGEHHAALARLEHERAEWQQRAETATTALQRAEAGLASHHQDLALRDDELRSLRLRVDEQARLLDESQRDLAAREAGPEAQSPRRPPIDGHVLMIARANGYDLGFSDDPCPTSGDRVAIDGRWFTVEQTGRSPLPGDERRCALVTPDPR